LYQILCSNKIERKNGYVAFFSNIFNDNIGDIIAENAKVTTLLPALVERGINTVMVFEAYYWKT